MVVSKIIDTAKLLTDTSGGLIRLTDLSGHQYFQLAVQKRGSRSEVSSNYPAQSRWAISNSDHTRV